MKIFELSYPRSIERHLIIGIILIISLTPNTLISQDISTIGEIYDYDISDIFHHEFTGGDGTSGERSITNYEIIGKFYSQNNDTVYYVRDVASMTISSWNPVWTYSYRIDTAQYWDLDSLVISCNDCYVYSNSSSYNGRLINVYHYSDGNYSLEIEYVVGCGEAGFYSFSWGGGDSQNNLVYYKKGDEEWGQQLIVGMNNLYKQEKELTVYPNPSTSTIGVKYKNPLIGNVSIYSIHGNLIDFIDLNPESSTIDLSMLRPNIYILVFNLSEGVFVKKLIKK